MLFRNAVELYPHEIDLLPENVRFTIECLIDQTETQCNDNWEFDLEEKDQEISDLTGQVDFWKEELRGRLAQILTVLECVEDDGEKIETIFSLIDDEDIN
jgi:uncharacterized protein Yka (UPF0111/DUF47 family)